MFDNNDNNICTLLNDKDIESPIKAPYPITDNFMKLTNNEQRIVDVKLGMRNTFIISTESEEKIRSDLKEELEQAAQREKINQVKLGTLEKEIERVKFGYLYDFKKLSMIAIQLKQEIEKVNEENEQKV